MERKAAAPQASPEGQLTTPKDSGRGLPFGYHKAASIRCQIDRAKVANKASPAPMIKRRPNLINVEGRRLSFAGRLILSSAFGFVTAATRYA